METLMLYSMSQYYQYLVIIMVYQKLLKTVLGPNCLLGAQYCRSDKKELLCRHLEKC